MKPDICDLCGQSVGEAARLTEENETLKKALALSNFKKASLDTEVKQLTVGLAKRDNAIAKAVEEIEHCPERKQCDIGWASDEECIQCWRDYLMRGEGWIR